MAVTRLADVFPAHKRRVIWVALSLEVAVLVTIAILLATAGITWELTTLYVILPVAVMHGFILILLGQYALEPLDFLSRTVTLASKQASNVIPPNLNGTRHEKTGFKLMVDTINQLAVNGFQKPVESATPSKNDTFILDNLPGGVIALDVNRDVIYTNHLAPISSDEQGKHSIKLMFEGEDTLESWLTNVEANQVSASTSWNRVQDALPGDPERKVYDVVATYQKNGTGGIDTLLLCVDQSKHYAVDEEDMDFIALAAHELRGPITVIKGYLDVLKPELEDKLNDDQRELMSRLEVSSNRLSGYVSNILNASKYDRRHLRLHLREERLENVYDVIADDLALRASTQNRMISVKFAPDMPTIAADSNSLSEVMANLVDNAIKYSREGGQVIVTTAVDGNFIRFSVQDFGIGIPSSVVGSLFSKFYRSHRSKHVVAGTGLGLYISKAIIESHGGTISLTSTEGEGSTFSFTVPIYSTVKDKLLANNNENEGIIETNSGWIKNHAMYRG